MGAYYDEIEIEDMVWDEDKRVYHYPCPCGDRFEISKRQLADCEDIATCPSCSLIIRVIYDPVRFQFLVHYSYYLFIEICVYSSTLRMNLRMMMILEWRRQIRRRIRRRTTRTMILSKMLWRR